MQVARGVDIPLEEIELRASRSSGPGGQHAHVTASRIEAVFDVAGSRVLGEEQRRRLMGRLGPRVTAVAQEARSQARNRELALERLQSGFYVDYSLVLAGTTLATIPILIVFIVLGRQIVAGIMSGAVKG